MAHLHFFVLVDDDVVVVSMLAAVLGRLFAGFFIVLKNRGFTRMAEESKKAAIVEVKPIKLLPELNKPHSTND